MKLTKGRFLESVALSRTFGSQIPWTTQSAGFNAAGTQPEESLARDHAGESLPRGV